ncbi:inositol 2-dehydrogenase [Oceanobacillus polygoni]|uniref:Myo-inositol 2-dehydrogenase/D-chiro-inositol 1-dehydrogenase n=1 Tax=Oceanobacillus polygoni TaxID=1235259 RepID=A0A9X1CA15_9BACI|nr:inositol 2-dehydrogenase [Oceanobacillus polygoni]MBP2076014.1 myo-inositol 2-dehydrogenase/D-chiro-inositol 1-dehydrogenase [Oceanobacillus polygoni]
MSKNEIIIGVIGAGRIGKLHVNNLKNLQNVRVKTVSDVFIDHLGEWFETSGAEHLTKNYQDIISDPEIDAILICSPTNTHTTIIKEAAAAGKHIFCEKPISFSDEETLEAFEAVKKSGVKFQIGFNRRYDHNFSKVKSLVEEKEIGDLHILKITSRDPAPPTLDYVSTSGGLFMDMTIHDFDMARFISGSEVVEVFAQGAALVNPKVSELGDIDTAIISLKFANGAVGVIDNSRQAVYGYDQRLEAFGTKGSANVKNETESKVEFLSEAGVKEDKPLHFFLERYNDAYIKEVKEFFKAIKNDEAVSCTFKDGIMAQRIAMAAKESFDTGKPVQVELLDYVSIK